MYEICEYRFVLQTLSFIHITDTINIIKFSFGKYILSRNKTTKNKMQKKKKKKINQNLTDRKYVRTHQSIVVHNLSNNNKLNPRTRI